MLRVLFAVRQLKLLGRRLWTDACGGRGAELIHVGQGLWTGTANLLWKASLSHGMCLLTYQASEPAQARQHQPSYDHFYAAA